MLIIQELFLFCLVSDKKPGIMALPLDPASGGGGPGGRGAWGEGGALHPRPQFFRSCHIIIY